MINISSLDFDLTDSIREEIMFLEPIFQKHLDDSSRVQVTLSKQAPDVFKVHMQTHYLGEEIVSDHESHNFHKALELCKVHFVKLADKRRDKVQAKG